MLKTSVARRSDRGHVMAQVAACQRAVGVATIAQPRLVEMRGGIDDLSAVAWMLSRRAPSQGRPVRLDWGWWLLDTPHRGIVLEDPAIPGRLDPFLDGLVSWRPDVALADISGAHSGVVIAGRLARSLTLSAAPRLSEPEMTAVDGDDFRLLVLRRELAAETRENLLEVGRSNGAVAVAVQATELYRAARRVTPTRAPSIAPQPFIDTTTTGAPNQ